MVMDRHLREASIVPSERLRVVNYFCISVIVDQAAEAQARRYPLECFGEVHAINPV